MYLGRLSTYTHSQYSIKPGLRRCRNSPQSPHLQPTNSSKKTHSTAFNNPLPKWLNHCCGHAHFCCVSLKALLLSNPGPRALAPTLATRTAVPRRPRRNTTVTTSSTTSVRFPPSLALKKINKTLTCYVPGVRVAQQAACPENHERFCCSLAFLSVSVRTSQHVSCV